MRCAFDNPEILDKIPLGVHLVILPIDDPELTRENRRLADSLLDQGEKVVLIKFKKPEVVAPELELLTA